MPLVAGQSRLVFVQTKDCHKMDQSRQETADSDISSATTSQSLRTGWSRLPFCLCSEIVQHVLLPLEEIP